MKPLKPRPFIGSSYGIAYESECDYYMTDYESFSNLAIDIPGKESKTA